MSKRLIFWRAFLKTLFLASVAAATSLLTLPATAQSTVAAPIYTSPLADYQPWTNEKVMPWTDANNTVGRIGGWRAYAKEAQTAVPPPEPAANTTPLRFETIAKAPLPIRSAWFKAVAAQEMAAYAKRAYASSLTSAELAKRMYNVGNFTRLQHAGQQAVAAESAIVLLGSLQEAGHARDALIRVLGLNEVQALHLAVPERLPDLPVSPTAEAELLRVVRLKEAQQYADEAPLALRSSYTAYRTAYDLSRHYRDEVLPVRKIMLEETTLRYNGMLVGVFELVAEHREQTKAMMAAIAAQLAFWEADGAFQKLLQTQLWAPAGGASD